MNLPDANKHNPDPAYLRSLIDEATQRGTVTSQADAAKKIGIEPRTLRYYLQIDRSDKTLSAPYAVQYALEELAGR